MIRMETLTWGVRMCMGSASRTSEIKVTRPINCHPKISRWWVVVPINFHNHLYKRHRLADRTPFKTTTKGGGRRHPNSHPIHSSVQAPRQNSRWAVAAEICSNRTTTTTLRLMKTGPWCLGTSMLRQPLVPLGMMVHNYRALLSKRCWYKQIRSTLRLLGPKKKERKS